MTAKKRTPEQIVAAMAATCSGCRWFRRHEGDTDVADCGDCRRYPPQLIVGADQEGDETVISVFPQVDESDGCGEFSPSN